MRRVETVAQGMVHQREAGAPKAFRWGEYAKAAVVVATCGMLGWFARSRGLADAILELAADPERRARMGRRAQAYADRNLGRGSAMATVHAFVASLLETSRHPVGAEP